MNIGIFCFYKNTILGVTERISQNFKGYKNLIDSVFDYINSCEKLEAKKQFPEL